MCIRDRLNPVYMVHVHWVELDLTQQSSPGLARSPARRAGKWHERCAPCGPRPCPWCRTSR
eukprot:5399513-Alexandrium_andersonii.AAC.1